MNKLAYDPDQKPREREEQDDSERDRKKEDQDKKIDEQLEESFPASDPPGYVESDE